MNIYVFLKVFAEISLYFGCIGALPALFPYSFFFLWPTLLCAACAAGAAFCSDQGRSSVRYLFLGLTAVPLLLGNGIMDILVLIPPVIYGFAMIHRDEWNLEYFQFSSGFRKLLIIFGIAVILVHFGVLIENRSDFGHVLDSVAFLRHYLIYAGCGILLQRQLRLGKDSRHSRYLNTLQLVVMLSGTGILVLAIAFAERYLSSHGLSLGQLLGQLLKYLLSVPLALMNYLFILLSELQTEKMDQFKEEHYSDIEPIPKMPMEEMHQLLPQASEEPAAFPWWLAVALLGAFTCILLLLTRSLKSRRTQADHTETVARIQPPAREKPPERRSNRSKLRKIYRDFLKVEKRKGHKLQPYHTSQNILENLRPDGNAGAAAKLRGLYLFARYDLKNPVTSRQIQEAKDALKQYKND